MGVKLGHLYERKSIGKIADVREQGAEENIWT
jgi:hypothetical protein